MDKRLHITRKIPLHMLPAIPTTPAQISLCCQIEKLQEHRKLAYSVGNERLARGVEFRIHHLIKFLRDG